MKTTHTQHQNTRHQSERSANCAPRNFPQIEPNFQLNTLEGGCGTPAKFDRTSFYKISEHYFAEEEPRSFAVEAGVFAALIAMALLPIASGAQAVAALIQSLALF